jgi:hypothetical protein
MLHFDGDAYKVTLNMLMGRWIIINGQRAYVGSNSPDAMVLYTDETATTPLFLSCKAGDVIYPADGRDIVSGFRTIVTNAPTENSNEIYFDGLIYEAGTGTLNGRWVSINGQYYYIGYNSSNVLELYKDSTKTEKAIINCDAGTTVYPMEVDVTEEIISEITAARIGAAPAYTYGTEDLEEGVSDLAPGVLYFVYEE